MSKADILQLVDDLSQGQAEASTAESYYDDITNELAHKQVLTNVTLLTAAAGDTSFTEPETSADVLAVFWGDRQLTEAKRQELEWSTPEWRSREGAPQAWITENEAEQTFRLYPFPNIPSDTLVPILGDPLGAGYADHSVAVLYTENREDLPTYLNLPVALDILAREFSRESGHKQLEFAQACSSLANILYAMVGVPVAS